MRRLPMPGFLRDSLVSVKLMYAWQLPQGAGVEEIQAAAQWMYYGGDLAEIALLVALMQQWLRGRRRDYPAGRSQHTA